MAINLDELRPSTARRIANGMCALFVIMALTSVVVGIRFWIDAPNGFPPFIRTANLIFSCVVAAVVFYVGLRFGRYARKMRAQHSTGV